MQLGADTVADNSRTTLKPLASMCRTAARHMKSTSTCKKKKKKKKRDFFAAGLAIQADGMIVVAGTVQEFATDFISEFGLARYDANGGLDASLRLRRPGHYQLRAQHVGFRRGRRHRA